MGPQPALAHCRPRPPYEARALPGAQAQLPRVGRARAGGRCPALRAAKREAGPPGAGAAVRLRRPRPPPPLPLFGVGRHFARRLSGGADWVSGTGSGANQRGTRTGGARHGECEQPIWSPRAPAPAPGLAGPSDQSGGRSQGRGRPAGHWGGGEGPGPGSSRGGRGGTRTGRRRGAGAAGPRDGEGPGRSVPGGAGAGPRAAAVEEKRRGRSLDR